MDVDVAPMMRNEHVDMLSLMDIHGYSWIYHPEIS